MPALHVSLLGGLTLAWGDVPLPLPAGVAARSLFAYLVTYRDRAHTRDLLAGTFWRELPDTVARRRLSRALWLIRRCLQTQDQPQPILTEGDTVQLNPSLPLQLDAEAFRQRVVGDDLQQLELAAELYQGEFLAGYYDDWLLAEREGLSEIYLATLERLAEGFKGRGEYEQALTYCRRLAIEVPWREEAHREVMRLCHLLGRDHEALKQFTVCRRVLAEELGVEPSAETASLAAGIARGPDVAEPPLMPIAARSTTVPLLERPDHLPLVGRQTELAKLVHEVEAASGGHGGLALIYGEAGVGKTRLVRELARNAGWRGLQVSWGRCYELAAPLAYQPLIEALRASLPTLHQADLQPLWRGELSRLLPELVPVEGLPPPLPPEEERRRLLEAIAQGFVALAREKPHLILLEDAHWMDPASLDAVRYLLPRLADVPLLLVLTARPEEVSGQPAALLAALESTRLPHHLTLGRLDLSGTAELIQHALALAQPASRFSARLYAETEGNPFFLIETLSLLVDEGLLYRNAQGGWGTAWDESTEDYAELPLPVGVVQSIERRLERLPARLAELLGLATVIGREVPFDLWHQASLESEAELAGAGAELCARGLFLCGTPKTAGGDYTFAHDQIRRVTYDRLTPPQRRLYHRQVARALIRLAPDEPEPLAYHWTQAEVWNRAAAYHQAAGDRARGVYANADAATHYTQALEAIERLVEPPDPRQVMALRLAREAVYGLQGERTAQAEELAMLEALAKDLGDKRQRVEVILRQASYSWAISDYPTTLAAARAAIELAQTQQMVELEAAGYLQWGQALWSQGEYEAAQARLEQALALAQETKLNHVEAGALRNLGLAHWYRGNNVEARACFEQALQIHRSFGDRQGEGEVFDYLGLAAMHSGDYGEANGYLEQALRIRHEVGDLRGEGVTLNYLGLAATHLGHSAQARVYLRQSLEIGHKIGDRQVERKALTNLGKVSLTCGQYAEAKACWRQALEICREIGDREGEGWGLVGLSLLGHHLGDYQAGQKYGQQALDIAQDIDAGHVQGAALTLLGHALAGLKQFKEAADAYRQALSLQRELGQYNEAMEALAGLAHIALQQGEPIQARDHIEEILRHLESSTLQGTEEPFWIYLICCQVLEAVRDPRSVEVLKRAYRLLTEEAARISDKEMRRSFLENVEVHRELVAAYQKRPTPRPGLQKRVRLPRFGASAGRRLRDSEYVTVTWTIDAPDDAVIPHKVDRRRYRIQRLLVEAQEQGAAPRDQDLAEALGVSLPTIRRDMATLRAEGHDLPTRGRK